MNQTCEKACCKMMSFFRSLCKIQLAHDGQLKLSMFREGEEQQPICSHTFQGSSKHSLCRLAFCGAVVMMFCSALRCCCGKFRCN